MTGAWVPPRPLSIAHRGASAYAPGNTIAAFQKAAILGADMWEVDIRATKDGVPVVFHDAALPGGQELSGLTRAALAKACPTCPDLTEVVALAAELGAGVYADIKDKAAALATFELLAKAEIAPVIIGAFDPDIVRLLKEAGSTYPVAGLVPLGADPHAHAQNADIIHLCWENMPRPQDSLTREFFRQAFRDNKGVVLWHEEDPMRMAELRAKPVIGICSDTPELVAPFRPPTDYPFGTVCHRGANTIAPENTLPAFECALAGGFTHIEMDLHITTDGAIVVIHDDRLDRTTDGNGPVTERSLRELRALDAGSWFHPHFTGTQIPTLLDVFVLMERYNGRAYLEFKTAPPAPVLQLVQRANLLDRVFFWSFTRDFLVELRKLSVEAQIMARRMDYPTLEETMTDFDANIIEFRPGDDPLEIAALRGSGLQSMVAYNGNDEEVFGQLLCMKPDLFNLNRPFEFTRFAQSQLRHG
jgi:glycerophosphoryl diester phosphodiesterase